MPTLRAASLTLLIALAAAAPARAADGEGTRLDLDDAPAQAASQAGGSGGSLVRTIVGLAVVLAVIYGLTWVLKQVKRSREATQSGTGLETLATLPLGPNRSLHLVQAGQEVVLLGMGEGGVTAIRTYPEAEARALGVLPAERLVVEAEEPPAPRGLLATLRRRTVIR